MVTWLIDGKTTVLCHSLKLRNLSLHRHRRRSLDSPARRSHHHLGNTLMAPLIHTYPQYSRHGGGKLPRSHRCLRGWKLLTRLVARERLRGYQSQQNWSRRVVAAWALSYKEDKDARGLPFSYHQVWTDFCESDPSTFKTSFCTKLDILASASIEL